MDRKLVLFLAFAVLLFGGLVLITNVQESAYDSHVEKLHAEIDETEQDLGIYDEDVARDMPVLERAKRARMEARRIAEETRLRLESIEQEALEAEDIAIADEEEESEAYAEEEIETQ